MTKNPSQLETDSCEIRALCPIGEFKKTFIREFKQFKENVIAIDQGRLSASGSWKDGALDVGLSISGVAVGAVIGVLAALAILTAIATAGIGLAVGLVAIGIGVGYHFYHANIKKKEYRRAATLIDRETIDEDIDAVADLLVKMYENTLSKCTVKDAVHMATSCFSAISYNLLKNKTTRFEELLHPALLQGLLMKTESQIPKTKLELDIEQEGKYNTQSVVTKPALYCKETDRFYRCESSRPDKYGVLFFETHAQLKEYKSIISKVKKDSPKWEYKKLHEAEAKVLKRDTLFNPYRNDKVFAAVDEPEAKNIRKLR